MKDLLYPSRNLTPHGLCPGLWSISPLCLLTLLFFITLECSAQDVPPVVVPDSVYTFVDTMPSYPGGEFARKEYLLQNINYPLEARVNGVSGVVYVNFIVEKDGSISNANIVRGIGKGCDEEVLRLIKGMPVWKPGKKDNRPVRTSLSMPVTFRISLDNTSSPVPNYGPDLNALIEEHVGSTVYLNQNYAPTTYENAWIFRNTVKKEGRFCVSDRLRNGIHVGYRESEIDDPFSDNGLALHYDNNGRLYATGRYTDNYLTGKWIYFDSKGESDTVFYRPPVEDSTDTRDFSQAVFYNKKKSTADIGQMITDSLNVFVRQNFHLPARTLEAYKNFIEVFVCLVDVDGRIVTSGTSEWRLHRDMIAELTRVLDLFVCRTNLQEPIRVPLRISIAEKMDEDGIGEIFTVVEDSPSFFRKGKGFQEYVTDELRKRDIVCDGWMHLFFTVDQNGWMQNIRIIKNSSNDCNQYNEILMEILKDIRWKPGRQRDVPVNVQINSRVVFPAPKVNFWEVGQ